MCVYVFRYTLGIRNVYYRRLIVIKLIKGNFTNKAK